MREKKIIDFFEEQVFLYPDNLAVIGDDAALTYRQLNDESNAFCDLLVNRYSIVAGDSIALNIKKKSSSTIAAVLGILKAEAVFLPLNPDHPTSIIDNILDSTRARVVLNGPSSSGLLDETDYHFDIEVLIDKPLGSQKSNDIAYSMYTSGTTGKPKGVSITNQNLVSTYLSWLDIYGLSREDNHLQMANISFDVFTGDWVRALCSGGTLVLCQTDMLLQPEKIFHKIVCHGITAAEFVPATLNRLVSYVEGNDLNLDMFRLLLCGSDLWSVSDAKKSVAVCGTDTKIYNSYGLTETTIDSTYFQVSDETLSKLDDASIVPIGIPFPHVTVSIRDENLVEVPFGTMGELVIGGKGVSPYGYIGAPGLTKQKFVPEAMEPASILYRTGDVARIKPDGCIDFQGRNELQININGKRVELPSIEYALTQHESIQSAVVSSSYTESGRLQLIAYIVFNKEGVTKLEILEHLENLIPAYAVPRRFYEIEELPLTMNGKVNRKVPSIAIRKELGDDQAIISNPLDKEVMAVWADLLGVSPMPLSSSFWEVGGTSLLYVEMLDMLNKKHGTSLEPTMKLSTVPELAEQIRLSRNPAKNPCFDLRSLSLDSASSSWGFPKGNSACNTSHFVQGRPFSTFAVKASLVEAGPSLAGARNLRLSHSIFRPAGGAYAKCAAMLGSLAAASFLCKR